MKKVLIKMSILLIQFLILLSNIISDINFILNNFNSFLFLDTELSVVEENVQKALNETGT